MTILFFSRLFVPHIGGVEKHVYKISQILLKRGHNVVVITENHGWKREETIDGIQIYRINAGKEGINKKFRIWNELWKLRNVVKSADIIHCHDVFFWYIPFRYLYAEKPVYTTFHGWEGRYPLDKKSIILRRMAEKFCAGNIAIGAFIEKWYGTKANFISYGGVNQFKAPKTKENINSKKKNILFLGRLEKDTGVLIYLDSVKKVQQKYKNLEVTILGEGNLQNAIKKRKLKTTIVVDTTSYIIHCDILLASSYLSILEGLMQKKQIIAYYDNPLKYDYLYMTPFRKYISIVKSEKEIINEIRKIIKNKFPINEAGYRWAKKQTWEVVTDTYTKLWNL